jgi:HK97 family phage prohead protease
MKPTPELTGTFAGRLQKLNGGRDGLRALLHPEIKATSGTAAPQIDFLASDETVDRYNEVITATGLNLDNYAKNPVFQNSHQYGDIIYTLGKSVAHEVRGGRLFQRIEFAVDVNPVAKIAYELYRGGFLRAVSVGFIPQEWEEGRPGDGFRRKFVSQELLELSAVSIPANPNALALGLKSGALSSGMIGDAADYLEDSAGHAPGSGTAGWFRAQAEEMRQLVRGG